MSAETEVSGTQEPPPLNKATKAAWKKTLKQLKLKDVGKKIEGIRYCATDARFFREAGAIPTLMTFLTRAKQHEILAQTVVMFAKLVTSNDPELNCSSNAILILDEGVKPSNAWNGGEYFLAIPAMQSCIDDDTKISALKIFTRLMEATIDASFDHPQRDQLKLNVFTHGDPLIHLLNPLDHVNAEMQYAAFIGLYTLMCGHPNTEHCLNQLHEINGIDKVLSFIMHEDIRFSLLALKCMEFITRHGQARECCQKPECIGMLTTRLEAFTTTLPTLTDSGPGNDNPVDGVCGGIELAASILTRLHVVTPVESPDKSTLTSTVTSLVNAATSFIVKNKARAETAVVVLSSLGRILECFDHCIHQAKEQNIMKTLVHYLIMDENSIALSTESNDSSELTDSKAKPLKGGKGGKDVKKDATAAKEPPPATTAPTEPEVDPSVAEAIAMAKAEAAEKASMTYLHARNAAEKILHICVMYQGVVDSRVFAGSAEGESWLTFELFQSVFSSSNFSTMLRGVRFIATVVQHKDNSVRLGVQAAQCLLSILVEQTKQIESIQPDDPNEANKRQQHASLVAYVSQGLVRLASDVAEVCELCGDEVMSPVTTLVNYVLENAHRGDLQAVNPLSYDWGALDNTILVKEACLLKMKPQMYAADALSALARGVLLFGGSPPRPEDLAGEKTKAAKDKKAKEVVFLVGEKVAQRVASHSLKLMDILPLLVDFDVHQMILSILKSIPSIPGGRKTLLRLAQERIVLENNPQLTDTTQSIEALKLVPPDGLTVGVWPFETPLSEHFAAYTKILNTFLHVLHRSDTPIYDVCLTLEILQSLLVDEKCPQDEFDMDIFANVAGHHGILVSLTALLDLPRLHVIDTSTHLDETLLQLLYQLIHHLTQLGRNRQLRVLTKLETYITDQNDTSENALQAVSRTKSMASRWTLILGALHDVPRFGYIQTSSLLLAVELRNHQVIKALLDVGVPPTVTDTDDNTSLMKAFATGDSTTIDLLIANGADVNAMNQQEQNILKCSLLSTTRLQSQEIQTAMKILYSPVSNDTFAAAVEMDQIWVDSNFSLMKQCLLQGSDPNISDKDGNFPLHWVLSHTLIRMTLGGCKFCFRFDSTKLQSAEVLQLIELLLQNRAHVNASNKLGQSALHLALANGHGQAALMLLDYGAHPLQTDWLGCLPLHYLSTGKCGAHTIEIFDRIMALSTKYQVIPGEYIDLRKGKSAPLKSLVELDEILDAGLQSLLAPRSLSTQASSTTDLLHHASKSGLLPFHYACGACEPQLEGCFSNREATSGSRLELLEYLVSKYKFDIKLVTGQGMNALHFAAKYDTNGSNAIILSYLIEKQIGLSVVHEPKPIDNEAIIQPFTQVDYLQRNGDLTSTCKAIVSSYCHFHYYHIITCQGVHASGVLREELHVCSSPSLLHLQGDFSFSPLHYAIQHSDNATWQLLHAGAELIPEGSDVPLLALACAAQRSVDVIEYLAPRLAPQSNVRVELSSTLSGTALHFAVSSGNIHIIKVLLSSANATMRVKRSSDGYTPLHIACENGSIETIMLLASFSAFEAIDPISTDSPVLLLALHRRQNVLESLLQSKFLSTVEMEQIAKQVLVSQTMNEPSEWTTWLQTFIPIIQCASESNQDSVESHEQSKDEVIDALQDPQLNPIEPEFVVS